MSSYKFRVENTYHYYGYPQSEDKYTIDGNYITIKLHHYGNQGYDMPEVIAKTRKNNGYFWELQAFMKSMYSDYKLQNILNWDCRSKDIHNIVITSDGIAELIK